MYYIQKNKETKINSENMHDGKGIIHRKPVFRDVSKLEVEIEEWILEPNVSEGDHTHSDNRPLEEIYYVLEGEGELELVLAPLALRVELRAVGGRVLAHGWV